MLTTEKAGTSLPPNCPELEPFIKAQAHIRAALLFQDEIRSLDRSHIPGKEKGRFHNLTEEVGSILLEALDDLASLQYAYFSPVYPIDNPVNK